MPPPATRVSPAHSAGHASRRGRAGLADQRHSSLAASCRVLPFRRACDPLHSGAVSVFLPPPSAERWKGNYMMGHHRCGRRGPLPPTLMEPHQTVLPAPFRRRGSRTTRSGWEQATSSRGHPHSCTASANADSLFPCRISTGEIRHRRGQRPHVPMGESAASGSTAPAPLPKSSEHPSRTPIARLLSRARRPLVDLRRDRGHRQNSAMIANTPKAAGSSRPPPGLDTATV